jgi:hypothetical protein
MKNDTYIVLKILPSKIKVMKRYEIQINEQLWGQAVHIDSNNSVVGNYWQLYRQLPTVLDCLKIKFDTEQDLKNYVLSNPECYDVIFEQEEIEVVSIKKKINNKKYTNGEFNK